MLVHDKSPPRASPSKASETETRSAIVRHLHNAIDTLCNGSLATSANTVGKAELDMTVINRLLAHCTNELASSAAEEAGKDLDMNEANASIRNKVGNEWKVMLSRQSGKPFYHNELSGATIWERPDKLTASGIGLELSPEALVAASQKNAMRTAERSETYDHDSFLVSVRKALTRLPEHNERVDIAGLVSRGLNQVADAVDNVVVSRACPASAIPFTDEALTLIDACGKLVQDPEVAWLLQDPTAQLKSEASQLKSLLALATTSVGNTTTEDIDFNSFDENNSIMPSSSSTSSNNTSHPREISRICRHILTAASEKTPSSLPNLEERRNATNAALKRLDDLKLRVLQQSKIDRVADGYDPRALNEDMKKLNRLEERLREQYRSSQARLQREKTEAVNIMNGYAQRERAINDLLAFSLSFALRNMKCAEKASNVVASVVAQEEVLRTRFDEDIMELSKMTEVLGRDAREFESTQKARQKLEKWRAGVFDSLSEHLKNHGSEERAEYDRQEYNRALQKHSSGLQQLRSELQRLADDLKSTIPTLRERLLEIDTRVTLKSWATSADHTFDELDDPNTSNPHPVSPGILSFSRHEDDMVKHEMQELSHVRKTIQSDISERSRCIHDLSDVIYDMDSRLAARVWERRNGESQVQQQASKHSFYS